MSALRHAGKRVENLRVDLSRVGLTGDCVGLLEAHFLGDQLLKLANFAVIPSKQA